MTPWLAQTPWGRQWARYGECWYCLVGAGEPCLDKSARSAYGRRFRSCNKPHPERRHTKIGGAPVIHPGKGERALWLEITAGRVAVQQPRGATNPVGLVSPDPVGAPGPSQGRNGGAA